ncbi:hypothetical protein Tco_1243660 [Tanacetum coccineum]
MGDEHLDTIPEKESDELIKSSVENLVPIPSESEDFSDNKSECDVSECDETSPTFTTFSNHLFDLNDDFTSSDDKSLSDEDVPMENFKIYSNSLFDDEGIIIPKIDPHYFNAESILNLLYDNSSPRPPEELNLEIADTIVEVSSHLYPTFSEELLNNDSLLLSENESSNLDHFNDPSPSRPPSEPPDVEICFDFKPDTSVVTNKVVGDISEHDVFYVIFYLPNPPLSIGLTAFAFHFVREKEDKSV